MLIKNAFFFAFSLAAIACRNETSLEASPTDESSGGSTDRASASHAGGGTSKDSSSASGGAQPSRSSTEAGGSSNGGGSGAESGGSQAKSDVSSAGGSETSNGSSIARLCEPGKSSCVGAVPRLCSPEGTWIEQPACVEPTSICDANRGSCVCRAAASVCLDSKTPATCQANGPLVEDPTCSEGSACSNGKCVCQGEPTCDKETATARVCRQGTWVNEPCALGCDGSACRVNSNAIAGKVTCDAARSRVCSVPTQVCSYSYGPGVTEDNAFKCDTAPGAGATTMACDGPGDCPTGQVCCKGQYELCQAVCRAAGTCGNYECPQTKSELQLCDPLASDCPLGTTCMRTVNWAERATDINLPKSFFDAAGPLYACQH